MYRSHRREAVAVIRADKSRNLGALTTVNLLEPEMRITGIYGRLGRLAHRHADSRAYRKQPRCSCIYSDRVRSDGNLLAGYAARRQQAEKRKEPARFHRPGPANISGFQII